MEEKQQVIVTNWTCEGDMIKSKRRKNRYLEHKKYVYDTFYLYGLRNQTPPKTFRAKKPDENIKITYYPNGTSIQEMINVER